MSEIRDPSGVLVFTLGDASVSADGFVITDFDQGDRSWRRITATSPVVDGEYEVQAARSGQTITLGLYLSATDWAAVSALRVALLSAVEVDGWRLIVSGMTFICRVADSTSPMPPKGPAEDWRQVILTIPVTQQIGV